MSYSFYEVLPFLVQKKWGSISFHDEFFKDIIKDKEELNVLKEVCNNLISAEGDSYATFNIPAFTRGDKTFPAKTFNIEVLEIEDRELDDCYEGKTFYHYTTHLLDSDTNEKMVLISHYYAATDHDLESIEIYLSDEQDDGYDYDDELEEAIQYAYVLINGEKSKYDIYGVFTTLEHATTAVKQVKKSGLIKSEKDMHIEKILANTLLIANKSYTINVLKDCLEAYDYKGTTLYSLS